ncbi:LPS assembly lipoprotein LptE [Pelagicoccus sp. SDUM812003]|uniref:LPS assembly lipoprotein LptE n=1 Tax=Pelagicoccus sp. SDUM812003 TaxID=3041267 RepID=UPI00280D1316|nr:LPS assembly lipoprotein LptE [Pelagicoccus sp. SDUM812003]MDQ8201978.1 LPS assembly lipoprotein LptE [Pelagicoccus sp. SDUM812003]
MPRIAVLFWALTLLSLSGCASYQLGSSTDLPYSVIRIDTPKNLTELAQVEAPLNAALREAVSRSATLQLNEGQRYDALLETTVIEAKREIAGVQSEDVGRGRKFELRITVSLSLRSSSQPDRFFIRDRQFEIRQDVYSDSGLVEAEYQAMPEISREIAERAVEIIEDLW